MSSALERLIKFAFEQCHLKRIEIHCGINNIKSRTISERLGFVNEGISQTYQPIVLNGEIVQSIIYSKSIND